MEQQSGFENLRAEYLDIHYITQPFCKNVLKIVKP